MSTPAGVRNWCPDENLIEHVRMCSVPITRLHGPDRAWVVAGLAAAGFTAEDTARQLQCSLRLIRQIRAEPLYAMAVFALRMRERAVVDRLARAETARRCRRQLAGMRGELTRMTAQRDKLIERRSTRLRGLSA